VINYLLYTQSNRDQQRELEAFKGMISPSLQIEATKFIFYDIIQMNPILQNSSAKMVEHVLQSVNTILFLPDDYIVKQGEENEVHE